MSQIGHAACDVRHYHVIAAGAYVRLFRA